jgi:hypothetical protein
MNNSDTGILKMKKIEKLQEADMLEALYRAQKLKGYPIFFRTFDYH